MGLEIYQTEEFLNQIDNAKRKGGIAADAAKKAEHIIKSLSEVVSEDPSVLFRYIGQQEHRIKNCRKIYLQGGYRIVFIHKDNCLICCFFGEHDDCFRWIEAQKKNKVFNKLNFTDFHFYSPALTSDDIPKDINCSEVIDEEDLDDGLWNYELPSEKWEEELFFQNYEQRIIELIYSTEGQRVIEGWFR